MPRQLTPMRRQQRPSGGLQCPPRRHARNICGSLAGMEHHCCVGRLARHKTSSWVYLTTRAAHRKSGLRTVMTNWRGWPAKL